METDKLHSTVVIVVVRGYLSYHMSTYSAGAAGGVPIRMHALVVMRMAITSRKQKAREATEQARSARDQ